MKNSTKPNWSPLKIQKNGYIYLSGVSGYYVDRFNDIYSTRRVETPLSISKNKFPSGAIVERVTLFDDNGKRRQRSRRKVLVDTLGKEEFERREALRAERAVILEKEKAEREIQRAKQDAETEKMLQEMHKDDFSGPKAPLLSLDPLVRNMVKKARAKREQETLGDLF